MTENSRPGYEKIYEKLLPALKSCPIEEQASPLGLALGPEGAEASFLGREFLINREGVRPLDGRECDVNSRSLLAYYIMSPGRGALSGRFLPLSKMTGMPVSSGKRDGGLFAKPLMEKFGQNYLAFAEAAEKLGGRYEGLSPAGAHSWFFEALPKIHLKILFFEADEEFPADLEFLFDEKSLDYLEFECLAFLNGALCQALLQGLRP